jgi:hypothetical protein
MIDRHDRTLLNKIANFHIRSSGHLLVEPGQRSHEAKSPRLPKSGFLQEVRHLPVPCFLRLKRGDLVDLDGEYGGVPDLSQEHGGRIGPFPITESHNA